MLKRIVEAVFSFVLLMLLAPFMGLAALAVKLDSPGPVIFKQGRVGYQGKTFTLYKFRTMFSDTDPLGLSPGGYRDRRITRVGRFLRKYAVDEWPQLYNILIGDMSFVGPRPQLPNEMSEYRDKYPNLCRKRLTVRPGLTCSWAIARDKLKIKPSLEMLVEDCRYVDNASLWEDLKIFSRTFVYLINRR